MVDVAQLVRAPVCGTGGRGFKSRHPPHIKCLELLENFSLISKHFLFPSTKTSPVLGPAEHLAGFFNA